MSVQTAVANLPQPFNHESFTLLQRGIYDSTQTSVYVNQASDFAFLFPLPEVDYISYLPRVKALGLSQYKKNMAVVARRYEKIQQCFSPHQKILEIGAGDGAFLRHVGNIHPAYRLACLEVDENTKSIREQVTGLHSYASWDHIREGQERFDVICMFHVLEHILDPKEFLTNCRACLAAHGTVIIEVPSLEDPLLSLYRSKAYQQFYFQRQHPYVYSSKSLPRLLEQDGLHMETVIPHQRYGLENHLNWLVNEKPGGHERFREIFHPSAGQYRKALEQAGISDAVITVARAPR